MATIYQLGDKKFQSTGDINKDLEIIQKNFPEVNVDSLKKGLGAGAATASEATQPPTEPKSTIQQISESAPMAFIDQMGRRAPTMRMADYIAEKLVGPDKASQERAAASPTAASLGKTAGDIAVSIPEYMAGMGALKGLGPASGFLGTLLNAAKGAAVNTVVGQGTRGAKFDPMGNLIDAGLGAGGELLSSAIQGIGRKLSSAPETLMNRAVGTTAKEIRKGKDIGQELVDRGLVGTKGQLLQKAESALAENESKLQELLAGSGNIDKNIILNHLGDLKTEFSKVPGQDTMLNAVDDIMGKIASDPKFDNLSASDANEMKRFIYNKVLGDRAYMADKLPAFAKTQQTLARGLKRAIEAVAPGAEGINKELSVYGQLKNGLLDLASKSEAATNPISVLKHVGKSGLGATIGGIIGGLPGAALGGLGAEAATTTLGRTASAQGLSFLSNLLKNSGGLNLVGPAASAISNQ